MTKGSALDQLVQLLQGAPPPDPDWRAILEVANLALITPRLERSLESFPAPEDVTGFVQEVGRRNQERNARLFSELGEAGAALNDVGLIPLVLKGGAILARSNAQCPRMISDLDLVVEPAAVESALKALEKAGFSLDTRYEMARQHAVAALSRPEDPGQIDLHQRPPGPPSFVSGAHFITRGALINVGRGVVRVPEPHMHIYLQALHDQLHDGGFWRGGFDLRHAWDIADLIQGPDPVDWERLETLSPTRLTARAVSVQLLVCRALTGAEVPPWACGWPARLHARRHRLQYGAPGVRGILAGLAVLTEAPNLLAHRRAARRGDPADNLPAQPAHLTRSLKRLIDMLESEVGGRL